MELECRFRTPDNFKFSSEGYSTFKDGILSSNSIRHALMLDKEAIQLFSKDNISLKKSVVKNFQINQDRIKSVYIDGFSYHFPSLIAGIVMPIFLFGFSYLTDSIFIWNSLIYILFLIRHFDVKSD